jgi:membrane associated rhomboid family serine protease
MIPLKTTVPTRKFPLITLVLIIANIIVFIHEISLQKQLTNFFEATAVIPEHYSHFTTNHINAYYPLFYSMFLHGGWFHLISNMWFLWIFATAVEDKLGHFRFLIFYLVAGIMANIFHILFNFHSTVPVIGASGAIAGVLGAYIVLFPYSRVITLIPLFLFFPVVGIPAVFFIGYWFLLQFLNGLATMNISRYSGEGGIAWWTHIGGFISGVFLLGILKKGRGSS